MASDPAAVRVFRPRFPLSQFVDCVWMHDGYAQPHATERVLPTGTMDLIFALDADGRAASAAAGARSNAIEIDTSRPFSAIGVHFRPGGGSPFVGVPGGELQDMVVPLDALWGSRAIGLRDRLWDTARAEDRVGILEQALLDQSRDRLAVHPAVQYAVAVVERSRGARPVGDIVGGIGMSRRRFQDVFRSEVGLPLKAFSRIRRFAAVLLAVERATRIDWADVALSCGYFDQAHFNHDFRAFAGLSPGAYLRRHVSRTHVAATESRRGTDT